MAALQAGPAALSAAAKCPAHCRQSPADGCRALPAPTCARAMGRWSQSHWPVPHWRKQNYWPFNRRTLLSMLPLFLPKSNSQLPAGDITVFNLPNIPHSQVFPQQLKDRDAVALRHASEFLLQEENLLLKMLSHQGSVILRSSYTAVIWRYIHYFLLPMAAISSSSFPQTSI